ncbi:HAD family hydrolase [Rudaeicoccus suwonensis]|uniref:HAD superfamily hydrolase (TIGR01484 family) n=1 Tax=Rudaeicoccus suwonensis TaxID=657409 RepID=A0A561E6Q4_9MICO|nr:HAD family hydrolase [Rudaeicoccus suwonensis]TWE11289.1 HAD superfamily hydrolase (TIGR01484 family) [Rudaeicoccus suwonensis]
MTRKLVALDIDGTLLHHDGTISHAVRSAVRAVADAGHHVVIATGRSVVGAAPVLEALSLRDGLAVTSNGAVTSRLSGGEWDIIETVTFDPTSVLEVLKDAWPDAVVAVEDPGVGTRISAPFPDGEIMGPVEVVGWEGLAQIPTTRLTFRSPSGTSEDFEELVERLGLHGVNYAVGYTAWLDINPEGVSKASALEQVRRSLQVEPADTVAIGDHRNDVEMLEWAARGVAMGQAPDEVKAIADEVTATIDEDGAAVILRELV